MEDSIPSMTRLFEQLGLSSGPADIAEFILRHGPLHSKFELADAPFWNSSQADFLRNGLGEDSVWSIVIDQLNLALRQQRR